MPIHCIGIYNYLSLKSGPIFVIEVRHRYFSLKPDLDICHYCFGTDRDNQHREIFQWPTSRNDFNGWRRGMISMVGNKLRRPKSRTDINNRCRGKIYKGPPNQKTKSSMRKIFNRTILNGFYMVSIGVVPWRVVEIISWCVIPRHLIPDIRSLTSDPRHSVLDIQVVNIWSSIFGRRHSGCRYLVVNIWSSAFGRQCYSSDKPMRTDFNDQYRGPTSRTQQLQ